MLSPRFSSTSDRVGARASARRRERSAASACFLPRSEQHETCAARFATWTLVDMVGIRFFWLSLAIYLRVACVYTHAGLPPTSLDTAAVLQPASTHCVGLGLRVYMYGHHFSRSLNGILASCPSAPASAVMCIVCRGFIVQYFWWRRALGAGLLVAQTLVLRVAVVLFAGRGMTCVAGSVFRRPVAFC